MLKRFKGKGGFEQLLSLIETSHPQKAEQLLTVIQSEDAAMASLVRQKMLTIDRIMAIDSMVLAEISNAIPETVLGPLVFMMSPLNRTKFMDTLIGFRKRQTEIYLQDAKVTPGEMEAARIKFVSIAREMENEGRLQNDYIQKAA